MSAFRLADVAPRLAKARDQLVALRKVEAEQLRKERDRLDKREAHLRALVEHRELMLLRASATRKHAWTRERGDKLAQAQRELGAFLAKRYPPDAPA